MSAKTQHIVEAAKTLFTRYGFTKTTIGDIAVEAGVARQTLYNAFPSKEDILRAVVRDAGAQTLEAVKQEWAETDEIDAKLEAFLRHGPLTWFEGMRQSPDWADLMEGVHSAARDEMQQITQDWRAAFRDMFAASIPNPEHTKVPLADLVDFFYAGSMNAKYGVDNIDDLKRRLGTIKVATLALI